MSDVGKYYAEVNPDLASSVTKLSGTVLSISGSTVSFTSAIFGATDYTGFVVQLAGQWQTVASNTNSSVTTVLPFVASQPTPSFSVNDRVGQVNASGLTTTLIAVGTTYPLLMYAAGITVYDPNMGHPIDGKAVARFCTICQVPYREDDGMVKFRGLWYCKYDRAQASNILKREKQRAWRPPNRKEPADTPFIIVQGPIP
jgi:hypothetical protein